MPTKSATSNNSTPAQNQATVQGSGGGNGHVTPLPPHVAAQFDEILNDNLTQFNQEAAQANAQSLAALFGAGINESNVGASAQSRLLERIARGRQDIRADDAQRRLSAQENAANRALQEALARLSSSTQLRSANIASGASLGASANSRDASILSTLLGGLFNNDAQRIAANANVQNSQLQALSSIFGSQAGALGNFQNSQNNALLQGAGLLGQLGLGQLNSNANILGQLFGSGTSILNAQTAADAQIRSANIAARQNPNSDLLALLNIFGNFANNDLQAQLTREGFANNIDVARISGQNALDLANANQPSNLDRLFGSLPFLAGLFGGF